MRLFKTAACQVLGGVGKRVVGRRRAGDEVATTYLLRQRLTKHLLLAFRLWHLNLVRYGAVKRWRSGDEGSRRTGEGVSHEWAERGRQVSAHSEKKLVRHFA